MKATIEIKTPANVSPSNGGNNKGNNKGKNTPTVEVGKDNPPTSETEVAKTESVENKPQKLVIVNGGATPSDMATRGRAALVTTIGSISAFFGNVFNRPNVGFGTKGKLKEFTPQEMMERFTKGEITQEDFMNKAKWGQREVGESRATADWPAETEIEIHKGNLKDFFSDLIDAYWMLHTPAPKVEKQPEGDGGKTEEDGKKS